MNPFVESVCSTEAPPGTAVLWWLGQMGLLIKMNQTVLCVDYYASVDPGRLMHPGRTSAVIPKYLEPMRISGTRPGEQL